uniref:EF-hand domain-containing protein n=1 Tax=Rhizochromulina marina TaxID=1034831 RepID=A0A7S2SXU0_9STRA|mmetsp:Transcript_9887/g.28073  ORF Transcript_9887/g.28073 Transcript_9887/m.28073 type:complete len:559 (+) Transcript_9887:35-1711(+)
MGLSDIFVDPGSLPQDGYGLCQLLTLLFGYAYVLYVASNMISDGSELLLLVPSVAGIVGSCVLPVLGAVPDGMIVLFSGLGPDAQQQLDVGVGALAGSTIMLITLPWALSVYAGRVDVEHNKAVYTRNGKKAQGRVTGVANSDSVRKGGLIMMVTAVSYIILQGPAVYFKSKGKDTDQVAQGQKSFALGGLILCLVFFFGYLYYQWRLSLNADNEVAEQRHAAMIIRNINQGRVTLRGAFYYEFQKFSQPTADLKYTPVPKSSQELWDELPAAARKRFESILRHFWRKIDSGAAGVRLDELNALFTSMNERVSQKYLEDIFRQFDVDHNGEVDFKEFVVGTTQYLWKNSVHATDGATASALLGEEDERQGGEDGEDAGEDDDEEGEMPDDLAELKPEEQQRKLFQRSFTTMGLGTILVVLFSDPMTDVLGELGTRINVSPFYVSFVLAPLASNASELIASYKYAQKKTRKSISISLQALQGAACMNNTFCLAIFMALIWLKGLAWEFSAETIAIVICQAAIAGISCFQVQTMTTIALVVCIYPACLALVAGLEAAGLD